MSGRVTVADAMALELGAIGVTHVFGIPSIHNLPIYDALAGHGGFTIVTARSEGGAANMADGYARATGKLGVLITSTGTGAGNAIGGLVEASTAGSPLLHLTGQVPTSQLESGRGYIHEFEGQNAMLEALGKGVCRVQRAEEAPAIVRRAAAAALQAPQGPISVEIPIDLQAQRIEQLTFSKTSRVEGCLDAGAFRSAARLLAGADRPVLWVGGGVIRSEGSDDVRKLADLLGAAVVTSQAGRGAIPEDHPLCVGHFASFPETKALIAAADVLLSAGVRFRGNETSNWDMTVPEAHISIDIDPHAAGRNFSATTSLAADARVGLDRLLSELEGHEIDTKPGYRREVEAVRKDVRSGLRKTLGPWEPFLDAIAETLPEDAVVVRDITIPNTSWGNRLIPVLTPRTSLHASGGGIGQGLPMAIGAQTGQPGRHVILLAGDGGFMLRLGDLATARDQGLGLTIVIYDDSGYGVIGNIQDRYLGGRRVGADLWTPDFETIGKAFGIKTSRVGDALGFRQCLTEAFSGADIRMIVVDMKAVGPMRTPFAGPPGSGAILEPHD